MDRDAVIGEMEQARMTFHPADLRASPLQFPDPTVGLVKIVHSCWVVECCSQNLEVRVTGGARLTFIWDGPTTVVTNHCHHDILKGL
jgi:hypothetical protein